MRIGFIGLGIMGRGMVGNLVRRGHDVAIWNRTRQVAVEHFPSLSCYKSPAHLAEACEVIMGCVSGPEAVDSILFGLDGVAAQARPGSIYIECSTIGPAQASANESKLSDRGMRMLAAPVTGSKLGALSGTLLFMTGGDQTTQQALEPLLLCMGERVIHCGTVAQAFSVKLANNTLVSFMLQGLCEGAQALHNCGVPLPTWLEVIESSMLAAKFYKFKGDALMRRDFATHFSLDLLLKDQNLMLELAAQHDVTMPGLTAIRGVFAKAQSAGHGADDMVGVVRTLERTSHSNSSSI